MLQMTLMAFKYWSRSSFRLTQSPTASSSVLNQRHTMVTTLFDTLSLKISRCVLSPIKQRTRLKIQLTAYVDEIFPALQYFFKSGLHQKSVGTSGSALSIQITHSIAQIELLDSQLNKIEEEMTDIMKFNDSVIMTIPGIGYINGGMILGEIGNIHRFSSPGKLLTFAGLDPSVYQSGNFQARRTKMSKRGSKVLRYALINAAHNVVKNNVTFKTYYDIKMAEGRTHYNVLGHCAGKLVRVIWKTMTNDLEFNLH